MSSWILSLSLDSSQRKSTYIANLTDAKRLCITGRSQRALGFHMFQRAQKLPISQLCRHTHLIYRQCSENFKCFISVNNCESPFTIINILQLISAKDPLLICLASRVDIFIADYVIFTEIGSSLNLNEDHRNLSWIFHAMH